MTFVGALLGGSVTCGAAGHSVIATGAALVKVADGFWSTEGATADASGNVFFTEQGKDCIHEWSVDGKLSTFLHPCGESLGLCFDSQGNLWACAEERGELWCIDPAGKATVVVKGFQGRRLDGPNDIWVRPDGGLYFTDPNFINVTNRVGGAVQDLEAVYYLSPDRQKLVRVITDLINPNGLIGTPDGKILYVASYGGSGTYSYDIQPDGTLTDKRLFCSRASDGMTIDDDGNVYLTGYGVYVYDKTGKQIEHINVPGPGTTNVCFGGKDLQTLFITGFNRLYAIHLQVKGVGSQ